MQTPRSQDGSRARGAAALIRPLLRCIALLALGCGPDAPPPPCVCEGEKERQEDEAAAKAERTKAELEARAFRELSAVLEAHAVDGIALSRPDCRTAPCLIRAGTDPCKLLEIPQGIMPFAHEEGTIEGDAASRPFFRERADAEHQIALSNCLFLATTPWETRSFVSWSVVGAPEFRYMQQLPTTKGHEVCGGGCATFERGKLVVSKYAMAQRDERRVRETYRWRGDDQGRGRFVTDK